MLKYGEKLDEKLYIKNNRSLKKNIFNNEDRQFRISLLVYNARCSLHFHLLGIDNIYEVDPVFQRVFNMFKCVGNIQLFP